MIGLTSIKGCEPMVSHTESAKINYEITDPLEKKLNTIQGLQSEIQLTKKGLSNNFGIKGKTIEKVCPNVDHTQYIDPIKLKNFADLGPSCRLILQNLKYLETIKEFISKSTQEFRTYAPKLPLKLQSWIFEFLS